MVVVVVVATPSPIVIGTEVPTLPAAPLGIVGNGTEDVWEIADDVTLVHFGAAPDAVGAIGIADNDRDGVATTREIDDAQAVAERLEGGEATVGHARMPTDVVL